MDDITKEEVLFSLKRLESFIELLDEDEFEDFASGDPVASSFIPLEWRMLRQGSFTRKIRHLELRLK